MKLSVSGSRYKETQQQRTTFVKLIAEWNVTELHQGKCEGFDEMAVEIVSKVFPNCINYEYPIKGYSKGIQYESIYKTDMKTITADRKYPLARNHKLVDAGEVLVTGPYSEEILHSGTWATIRYARKLKRPIYIIMRDGELRTENV